MYNMSQLYACMASALLKQWTFVFFMSFFYLDKYVQQTKSMKFQVKMPCNLLPSSVLCSLIGHSNSQITMLCYIVETENVTILPGISFRSQHFWQVGRSCSHSRKLTGETQATGKFIIQLIPLSQSFRIASIWL